MPGLVSVVAGYVLTSGSCSGNRSGGAVPLPEAVGRVSARARLPAPRNAARPNTPESSTSPACGFFLKKSVPPPSRREGGNRAALPKFKPGFMHFFVPAGSRERAFALRPACAALVPCRYAPRRSGPMSGCCVLTSDSFAPEAKPAIVPATFPIAWRSAATRTSACRANR